MASKYNASRLPAVSQRLAWRRLRWGGLVVLALVLSASCRPAPLATFPAELVWQGVAAAYGALWLASVEILDQEPSADGQVLVYRVLDPLVEPRTAGPRPVAILLFARPVQGGWQTAGGGAIGTIALMDHFAVSCAWTWLRDIAGEPTIAAFYCTVENPRVAAIELERMDGAVQRVAALALKTSVRTARAGGRPVSLPGSTGPARGAPGAPAHRRTAA